jgi:uncharacterized integral membrane protein
MRFRRSGEPREATWQAGLYLKLFVLLLVIGYAVAFVIKNSGSTKVDFVFASTKVSRDWLILLCFAVGLLSGVLLSQLNRRRSRRRQKRSEPAHPVVDLPGGHVAEGEPGGAEPVPAPREEV